MDNNKNIKIIEVGKFYLIHDGSKTGHPGLIISKNDIRNEYLVIRTESDKPGRITKRELKRQHLITLKHPTDNNVICSYVRTKPLLCKRKDIGSKELIGMRIHVEDQNIIDLVSRKKPQKSKSWKK